MESVTINSQHYNLYKNLQDFVKFTIRQLIETNSLPEYELKNLEDKDYCKKTFNLNYPMLSKDRFAFAEDKKHPRYYAKEAFFEKEYYLCNHWFNEDKEFANWLKTLSK